MTASSYTDNMEYLQRKERLTECLLKRMSAEEIVHEAAVQFRAPVILTTSLYRVIVMDDLGMEVSVNVKTGPSGPAGAPAPQPALASTPR